MPRVGAAQRVSNSVADPPHAGGGAFLPGGHRTRGLPSWKCVHVQAVQIQTVEVLVFELFRHFASNRRTSATTNDGENKTGRLDRSRPVSFVTRVRCLAANLDGSPLIPGAFNPDLALGPVAAGRNLRIGGRCRRPGRRRASRRQGAVAGNTRRAGAGNSRAAAADSSNRAAGCWRLRCQRLRRRIGRRVVLHLPQQPTHPAFAGAGAASDARPMLAAPVSAMSDLCM